MQTSLPQQNHLLDYEKSFDCRWELYTSYLFHKIRFADELHQDLFKEDLRHINTDSDSEVLLNIFALELKTPEKIEVGVADLFNAFKGVHKLCRGAYAFFEMLTGKGI